jgi:hypothetical protein
MKKTAVVLLMLISVFPISFAQEKAPKRPAVLVLMDDYIDGTKNEAGVAAAEIEKVLTEIGFSVVSSGSIQRINMKELMPVYTVYPGKVAEIGRKYKADAVIIGTAGSNAAATDVPYGAGIYAYQAKIDSRTVKTKTGMVITMDKATSIVKNADKNTAALEALKAAGRSLAQSVAEKIKNAWESELSEPVAIKIIYENATPEKALLLEKALKFTDGVKEISKKPFRDKTLELDVIFFGDSEGLANLLRQLPNPSFEIRSSAAGQITLRFIDENPDFTR